MLSATQYLQLIGQITGRAEKLARLFIQVINIAVSDSSAF